MFQSVLMAVGAALFLAGAPAVRAQDALQMRVVRYYRHDASQTMVKAFVEVPFALLSAAPSGPDGGMMVYTVAAQISDSTGLSLLAEPLTWTKRVPAAAKVPGASALEPMEFAVAAGLYRMKVTVTDSVSGRKAEASTEFRGYATAPVASDLLLSPAMRLAGDGDTVPQPGEMRRGNTIIVPSVVLRLTPLRTKAYYLVEAYSDKAQETAGTLQVTVLDSAGNSILRTAAKTMPVASGGGQLEGQLDLDGLPPGRYEFVVKVAVDGQEAEQRAPLVMASMQETLARDSARTGGGNGGDEAYFAAMDEAQLDSAEVPLMLIARSSELSGYDKLSVSAKRRFLTEFWKKRDFRPETARNEERERFYQALAYADQAFKVGRGTQEPGWRTDRGRIYAKYGAADDQLNRVQGGFAPAYEVWRYTRGKSRYYVFADRNGFGAYKLVYTNDLTENGVPNWREIVTEDAVKDIGQYLGIDFYASGSGTSF